MTPDQIQAARRIIKDAGDRDIDMGGTVDFALKAFVGWPQALDECERLQSEMKSMLNVPVVAHMYQLEAQVTELRAENTKLRAVAEAARHAAADPMARGEVFHELRETLKACDLAPKNK